MQRDAAVGRDLVGQPAAPRLVDAHDGVGRCSSGVNRRALAAKYSSIVPWKSRWSWRQVGEHGRREPGGVDPVHGRGRATTPPWRRPRRPGRRWSASRACSSGASGVVRAPDRVPITPHGRPAAASTAASRWVIVVLPFVPVTPTTVEVAGRVVPERRGDGPHGGPHVVHDELGHVQRELVVDQQRRGARRHGRRRQVVAVDVGPPDAAEQRAADDGARVVDDRDEVGITIGPDGPDAHSLGGGHEVGEAHALSPGRPGGRGGARGGCRRIGCRRGGRLGGRGIGRRGGRRDRGRPRRRGGAHTAPARVDGEGRRRRRSGRGRRPSCGPRTGRSRRRPAPRPWPRRATSSARRSPR